MQKDISFEFKKGPKFAKEFVKEETDLTADMLARYIRPTRRNNGEPIANKALQWSMEEREIQALQLQFFRSSS